VDILIVCPNLNGINLLSFSLIVSVYPSIYACLRQIVKFLDLAREERKYKTAESIADEQINGWP